MPIGLTSKIYLYSIIAVFVAIGVVHVVAYTLQSEHRRDAILASGHMVRSLWLSQRNTESGHVATTSVTESIRTLVTLYDTAGRLVASTATPPFPLPPPSQRLELREKGFLELGHALTAHEVREAGRVVGIGIVRLGGFPPLRSLAVPVFALFATLLAVALLFTRQLARPLGQMSIVAKKFGNGDLRARVGSQRRDEIGEVGRAFDAMADRVAGLMAAQQELMANVSHELRTPIARIRVAVDLITEGKAEQVEELVPGIAQDLVELERLIDDVLTLVKLDLSRSSVPAFTVPIRTQVVSVEALLEETASRFRARYPSRALSVDVGLALPELSGDPVLLRRVVDNLLENARKFSDEGSTIRLSADATHASVSIAVADQGIGIDDKDIENVFTPFFRGDRSRSRSTGGVGLGLALARRVAEAHQGTIEISSQLEHGTTVTLVLPATPVA